MFIFLQWRKYRTTQARLHFGGIGEQIQKNFLLRGGSACIDSPPTPLIHARCRVVYFFRSCFNRHTFIFFPAHSFVLFGPGAKFFFVRLKKLFFFCGDIIRVVLPRFFIFCRWCWNIYGGFFRIPLKF